MKSKLKFDINADNEAVIHANVIPSDDVRDKIAARFLEKLGGTGSLVTLTYHPYTKDEGSTVELRPFYGVGDSTKELLSLVSMDQLMSIHKELPKEISRREAEKKKVAKLFLDK